MAQVDKLDFGSEFQDDMVNEAPGRSTVKPSSLDQSLGKVSETVNAVIDNLQLIQRDDGKLMDGSVGLAQLQKSIINLLKDIRLKGEFKPGSFYTINDCVDFGGNYWVCIEAHQADIFDENKWNRYGTAIPEDISTVIQEVEGYANNARTSKTDAEKSAQSAIDSKNSSSNFSTAALKSADDAKKHASSSRDESQIANAARSRAEAAALLVESQISLASGYSSASQSAASKSEAVLATINAVADEVISDALAASLIDVFPTEVELLASTPVEKKYARALDTHKLWAWSSASWAEVIDPIFNDVYGILDNLGKTLSSPSSYPIKPSSYIAKTNGVETPGGVWLSSGFIPVTASDIVYNKNIIQTSSNACAIALYDSSKAFIGHYNPKRAEERIEIRSINASTAFVRFTLLDGFVRAGVVRYAPNFNELLKNRYVNMINYAGVESGAYWSSTGENVASASYSRTRPIFVSKGSQFIISCNPGTIPYVSLFNKNFEFLRASIYTSGEKFNSAVYEITDSDVTYVVFNYKNADAGSLYIFGVGFDSPPSYILRKKFVNFGDSISANYWNWPAFVASHFQWAHKNFAVSGSTINSALNVAVASDYSDADYIVLTHGTNDFALDTPLGTIDDVPNRAGSFYARYKWVLEQIMMNAMYARIVLVTPLYRTRPANSTQMPQNADGKTIGDYAKAVRDLAEKYHLKCFDLYAQSGFNDFNMMALTDDGLHPTRQSHFNILRPMYINFFKSI